MSEYTKHYNLKKPTQSENYNVEDANLNNEIIDNALYGKADKEPGKGMSTNDFTDNYKKKIDTMQTLYRPMGTVDTVQALQSVTTKKVGDLYRCKQDENNYVWNGQEWVNIGQDADYSELTQQIEQVKQSQQELVDDMSKTFTGTNITAPTVKGGGRVNKVSKACWQETREGYNLVDLVDGTYTNNGITAIVKNGIVTLNGTATAISFIDIPLKNQISFLPNKTYRVYAFNKAESNLNDCGVRPVGIIGVFQAHFNQVNATNTYTFAEATQTSYLTIRTANEKTYTNFVIKPQITEGTEEKPYEQYDVSPSPNYTAQIHCLGDDKNVFDIDSKLQGTINEDGDLVLNNNTLNFYEYNFKENTQYTFSAYVKNQNTTGNVRLRIFYTDGTNSDYVLWNNSTEYQYKTFTSLANKTIDYIANTFGTTGAILIKDAKLKIQEGTISTPWSPFRFWYNSK